ncbi:MAG TPA: DUF2207 domain-containing protein, partial [Gemmatimonadales bacterium]|nr:DUF2207 domain-containing protein [Gemmatimonadales bacterium]
TIQLSLTSATDEQGTALRTETSRDGALLKYKVWVPGAQDVTRTIALRYHARNALRFFDDHDELYWNVTGNEWDVALGDVTATITLPDGAAGVRAAAFNGVYGATAGDARVAVDGNTVRLTMPRKLEFKEGLTAVVGWDKGLVAEPTRAQRAAGFLAANWPIALPFPILILMLMHWSKRGRDPRQRPITVQYEPPPGMTPAEVGTLTDESVDMRDITASMVDLAVRGFLKIEEVEESQLFGLFKTRDYVFHRLRPASEWSALSGHERAVLEGIFDAGADTTKLSDLKNEFYKNLPGIKDGIMDRLVEQGLYVRRPDSVRNRWRAAGLVSGAIITMGGSVLGARLGMTPLPFFVAGIATGLIILVIGHYMPARTEAGARTLEKVLGFSEFLERVEKDRFERVIKTPELFEKYLPFAMALGVDQQWAGAFKGIYTEPPTWYVGAHPGTFNMMNFSNSLSTLSSSAGSAMSSAPRSSGGSGFSGGSSGGGGGGGGGGGF